MYSNSNSYLGGNSQRPGPQQQGGSFNNMAGGQQQSPFASSQPTGFGQQQPLQQQYTGYPMQSQPLQQQYTGYPGQGQAFNNNAPPPMPSMPSQYQSQFQQQQGQSPQQTGFQPVSSQQASSSSQPPPVPMKPQQTGFTEMAASFQTGGVPKPAGRRGEKPKTNKIPNIRLSFITAQDQSKFETLFKSAVGEDSTTMSGDKARDLLMRSRLDGDALSQIW